MKGNRMKRLAATIALTLSFVLLSAGPASAASATPYLSFLNHRVSFLDAVETHLSHGITDLDDGDYYGSGYQQKLISAHYAAETKWTTAHKPLTCYKALWNAVRHEAVHGKSYYAANARWLLAFPYGTDADYDTGRTQSDLLDDAADVVLAAYDNVTC
jgi:hypothetical protein